MENNRSNIFFIIIEYNMRDERRSDKHFTSSTITIRLSVSYWFDAEAVAAVLFVCCYFMIFFVLFYFCLLRKSIAVCCLRMLFLRLLLLFICSFPCACIRFYEMNKKTKGKNPVWCILVKSNAMESISHYQRQQILFLYSITIIDPHGSIKSLINIGSSMK